MKTIVFRPQNVCSQKMTIEYDEETNIITHAEVEYGCKGNLQGICRLIEGMEISKVIKKLEGIQCRNGTSCPDQLARGLKQFIK